MSRRQEVLDALPRVPGLPVGASRAIALAQDPTADLGQVARLIEYDAGLTSNVLRLVNSPHFSRGRSVGSVRQAIVLLGARQVAQLLLASAVAPLAWGSVKGYVLAPGQLWEHFIGTAVGATRLAEILRIPVPEHAFTAGLLHDIGKIVLSTFVEIDATPIQELVAREGIPFAAAERQLLGIDHAEVGALLLEGWKLPQEVTEPVRWHHEPEKTPGSPLTADLVHVADLLCLLCGVGMGADGLKYLPSKAVMTRLGVREATLEALAGDILSELETIRGMFAAETGGSRHGSQDSHRR